MFWLAFLVYWRRALRGWRLGCADHQLRDAGLIAPTRVMRPLEAPEWSVESVARFEKDWRERSVPIVTKSLTMTDAVAHADYFQRNLVAIRAEERLAMHAGRWSRFKRWIRRAS